MTTRETILEALSTTLQTISGPTVIRGEVVVERVPVGGILILRDGEPGEPEVTLSPLRYHWQHRADLEVIVQDKDPAARASAFDGIIEQIDAVLTADRTLGGLCDWLDPAAPEPVDIAVVGGAAEKSAVVPITLYYSTTAPMG